MLAYLLVIAFKFDSRVDNRAHIRARVNIILSVELMAQF
jgi:hypothetical protein